MTDLDETMGAFSSYGIAPERIAAVLDDARARVRAEHFYVFQIGAGGAGGASERRPRTLMAFASPDAALLFAQRNRLIADASPPRLRRMGLTRLLLAMAHSANVHAILLVPDAIDMPPGHMPDGVLIERSALIG